MTAKLMTKLPFASPVWNYVYTELKQRTELTSCAFSPAVSTTLSTRLNTLAFSCSVKILMVKFMHPSLCGLYVDQTLQGTLLAQNGYAKPSSIELFMTGSKV